MSILFAAFLGYNPIQHLSGSALRRLPPAAAVRPTSPSYLPSLLAAPFRSGLHEAFGFAIAACLIAAIASWSRGGRYVHDLHATPDVIDETAEAAASADLDGRLRPVGQRTETLGRKGRVPHPAGTRGHFPGQLAGHAVAGLWNCRSGPLISRTVTG